MRHRNSILFAAFVGLVVACGGGGSGGPRGGSPGTGGSGGVGLDCETLGERAPDDCFKPCTSNNDCTASFCRSGECQANCVDSLDCGASEVCTSVGTCLFVSSTGGTGGTGGVGECQDVTITPSFSIPNVMFLVDQSGSMDANDFGPGNLKRWTAAHTAITEIVAQTESIVRFGLTTYDSDDGFVGGATPECPIFGPASPPAEGPIGFYEPGAASGPINANYSSSFPGGEDTPTGASINSLVDWIQTPVNTPPAEGPTIIVVATDGEPDSCTIPDPSNSTQRDETRQEVVDAAARAHSMSIDVFVLWVGRLDSSSTRNHLQEVADAGVNGTGTVWVGDDPDSLENAFEQIVGDSISCDIQMAERFDDKEKACNDPKSDVRLGGVELPCSDTDGWRVKPGVDDMIELVGSACDTYKGGGATFSAKFPCGAIVVD